MKFKFILFIIFSLLLLNTVNLIAEENEDIKNSLQEVSKSIEKKDYLNTLENLWQLQEKVWNKAPLGVRNVAFITEQTENYGVYKAKIGEVFTSAEPLILYCEPIGFTQAKTENGYKYSLIGSFEILNKEGEYLGGQQNLGPYEQSNYQTFSTETMLVMTFNVQGLPDGQYILRVNFTDNLNSKKSVRLDKKFLVKN